MINFILKYTGAYGLLAILAVAIITPTYLFLSNQNEQIPPSIVKEEKGSNEKEVSKKKEPIKKADINNNETIEKSEESLDQTKKNKSIVSNNSLSVDIFRVDELGNIISAGKVSQKAKVEILSDKLKIIGSDTTDDDGSFVVFGKVQGSGLVQTVKIRGLISDGVEERIIDSADLFFVLPQVEKNNEKEDKIIEKSPFIIKDDGNDLKLLAPVQVSSVNSITLDTISYSDSSDTDLAGRARLNNSVRIYLDNKLKGEVRVNDSGAWKTSLSGIEPGIYTLRLDEVNSKGSVEGRLELPFKKEDEELIQAMGEGSITVQPGNSLWRIARKYYGKGIQYVEIFERNSHLIKDPNLIYPGQVFSLPN